jgi:threonine dehydratase
MSSAAIEALDDARPILTEGDERLRRPCAPVAAIDATTRDELEVLCRTLTRFRRQHGFGRAIAAPQIGIARRAIALDLGAGPFVLLNPEIVWRSEETFELWDDCFSVPDKLVRVRRHASISLTYRDSRFRLRHWSGLRRDLSELLQHEIDHLDGVLMTDRAIGPDAIQPAARRATLVDVARPAHRLALASIAQAARAIDPVFLRTPQFVSEPLSDLLGCELTLKVETLNPLRCFKGRGADWFVQRWIDAGNAGDMVCASAGNFGQALAYACRKHRIPVTVYAAVGANGLKLQRMRALGALVRLEGADFDAAKEAARGWAEAAGATLVEDGLIPAISEGAGSIAVELLGRDDAFDTVLVPLGNGALINGIARWIKAAAPATRVIGVCSTGAPAMARAWRSGPGAPIISHPVAQTIADGIAVRVPIVEAVEDMRRLVDDVLEVDDETILEAMRLLHQHTGLVVEPAGAAGLAALLAARDRCAVGSVATVLCGGNVTPQDFAAWRIAVPQLPENAT